MTDAMICRAAAYREADGRDRPAGKVLTFGGRLPDAGGPDAPIVAEYFPTLGDPAFWADVDALRLGNSMRQWLPALVLRALLRAAEAAAGRPVAATELAVGASPSEATERALGAWLMMAIGRTCSGGNPLSPQEIEYLVTGGGYRGAALIKALRGLAPGGRFCDIADIGAGIGLIPLMLMANSPVAKRSAWLVEPNSEYVRFGRLLWSLAHDADLEFQFHQCRAEETPEMENRDLVFFGQCLYRIERERRREVLARAAAALARGGLLIVNEAVRSDPADPDAAWDSRLFATCAIVGELCDALATIGEVSVLRRASDWRRRENPRSLRAAEIGLDSFFVVSRRWRRVR